MSLDGNAPTGATTGKFSYMAPAAEPSLLRNGKVYTKRDTDGSDAGTAGVVLEVYEMPIANARDLSVAEQPKLESAGFELLTHALPRNDLDFLDHEQVVKEYYPHCADFIRAQTGARLVAAFDHNVRSAQGKKSKQRIEGGQQVQGPAHLVHGDYTMTSAPQRLRDLTNPAKANDTFKIVLEDGASLMDAAEVETALAEGRFAIINLWRNIVEEPVATHPMALCDAATVEPEDLVVFEIHYADRVGENYFAKHAERHGWYYYPAMTRDEALLIKQWDSEGEMARSEGQNSDSVNPGKPCTFSFHSAFEDPSTPEDAPDRWSIEVRCMVMY